MSRKILSQTGDEIVRIEVLVRSHSLTEKLGFVFWMGECSAVVGNERDDRKNRDLFGGKIINADLDYKLQIIGVDSRHDGYVLPI